MTTWARFDDLHTGTALLFPQVHEVLVANRPADVVPVLQVVQRATDAGRWAYGFVSYEAASALDPSLAVHRPHPDSPPLAWFGITDAPERTFPISDTQLGPTQQGPTQLGAPPADQDAAQRHADWWPAWTPEEHFRDVERVRDRIERGDTYQCNLTVRMRGRMGDDPLELYRHLALAQRGAYNAYLDLGRFVVASASPELFFERTGDELLLRPMKGTAPRGRTRAEDRRQENALRTSPKERAENIMIVDLIRNDAARVARVGGVRVRDLCEVERYETVLQLTSTVAAQLRPGVALPELFGALFPSGSVTGAPKTSTMALISELERTPRGVYCGAIGFVAPTGHSLRARFNVAIRTAVLDRALGTAEYGVGGGITWSSDPHAEHREVVTKTAVLHRRHREFELLETMRFEPKHGLRTLDGLSTLDGLRNLDRHLWRLAESAEYFGFHFERAAAVRALDARLSQSGPARVRLRLRRDGELVVDLAALPDAGDRPVALVVDEVPVDSSSPWLYHKTTLREPYENRRLRHPEADDVVLINERGELTETSTANMALRLDGRWWTPALDSGCLPGTERGRLLELGTITERILLVADLHRAEEVAVLNSLRGWRTAKLTSANLAVPVFST
jgi:para-aminobenzoate synthetase / 4-amino-4-deoxychorismate lyase